MRFKKVYLEIGNICNLNCSFCIKNSRVAKQLTFEEFQHILNELKPYTKYLYFHVLGEPLLHPNLELFLNYAHEKGYFVNLTTNGTLLSKQCDMLVNAPSLRQINISVHNFGEQRNINLNQYLADIRDASIRLTQANKYVSLRLWNMKDNTIDQATIEIFQYFLSAFQIDMQDIKAHDSIRLGEHLYLQFDEVFEWPTLEQPYVSDRGRCYGLKQMIGILSNGDVVPCCLDSKGEAVLGNIFSSSLQSILGTDEMKERMELRNCGIMKDALCQHCSFKKRFEKEIL